MTDTVASADRQEAWTPNQHAARRRIVESAADLVGQEGLSACTVRAVAERAGLTKSTVHYYFDDANELVDLSVNEILARLARYARESVLVAADASDAVEFLVRLFMGRGKTPAHVRFGEEMLWPAYVAHAWKRGAKASILEGLETLRSVVQLALERSSKPAEDPAGRANSVHSYLIGAMMRNMVEPIERGEVAQAVSALSGLDIDADHC